MGCENHNNPNRLKQAVNLSAKLTRSVRILCLNTVHISALHSTNMSSLAKTQPGIALVTGASSGIGRSAAIALGKAGWTVVICARRAEALEETGQMVQNAGGREVQALVADLSQPDDISRLFDAIREDYGE
jgi:NADPH:quinone reductase-like Zn-dependent oxidoreductase